MKHLLFTILAVLFTMTAMAQNDGSTCEQAIYVDSLMMQSIEANTTYWFTANTDDLPLTVYFFPDEEPEVAPEIYIDFTCEPGVYEDQNIRDIVDLAIDMGIYFPLGAPFDTIEVDGAPAYRMSYERDLLELLVMLGIDYSVPVYVSFRSPVSGSAQVSNIKTVTLCSELHQRVEMKDTIYLQANRPGLVYFPVTEWKDNKMSFTWTGSTPIRAYLEPDCDFDTLTSKYVYEFDMEENGFYTQKIIENDIDNYIRDMEDGNMYVLFMAPEDGEVYVGDYVDHGAVTINTCTKNAKSTAIDFPTASEGVSMVASIPSKSYRFEASTIQNKNIRLKWKTTENKLAVAYFANFCGFDLIPSDPDVIDTVHFVYNEAEQAMIAEMPMDRVNKLVKQNTDGWLFMQIYRQEAGTFWWDTYEIVEPDCDTKSILLQPNDSAYMPANYYNTSYKMPVDAWGGHKHTFTWRGNRKAYVFIADTCSFPLAPYNMHVGKYMELSPNSSVELSQSDMDYLVNYYADGNNNLYLRLRSDDEGYLVTHQVKVTKVDTVETSVSACETYTWKGTEYTQSGDYEYFTRTTQGDEILEILHLTINHGDTAEFTVAACDTYTWHGTDYTTSGDYTYLTQTISGCDSLEILHLTINHSTKVEYTETACDSYTWNGTEYTQSGDYEFLATTALGCDSIEVLHLTINHSAKVEYTESACDSYTWNGIEYTQSGDYEFAATTALGCDSIEVLHLTINHGAKVEYTETACDTYTWNGTEYTQSGEYEYLTQTVFGCDSLEILHLIVNYSDTVELVATVNGAFTWHDTEYTESGTYTYLTQTAEGCDSLEILVLTINGGAGIHNPFAGEGANTKMVMINQSLYIMVTDSKGTNFYDLTGRKVEIEE